MKFDLSKDQVESIRKAVNDWPQGSKEQKDRFLREVFDISTPEKEYGSPTIYGIEVSFPKGSGLNYMDFYDIIRRGLMEMPADKRPRISAMSSTSYESIETIRNVFGAPLTPRFEDLTEG